MKTIIRHYHQLSLIFKTFLTKLVPYIRRIFRFAALPYAYFKLVNWHECNVSRFQVIKDLLYIFFVLKYYPDNYTPCRLWEIDRKLWKYYYGSIYDPYQRRQLRKKIQIKEYKVIFDDKYICYQLCKALNLPRPKQYGIAKSFAELKSIVNQIFIDNPQERLILKPNMGNGGKGIHLCYRENDKTIFSNSKNKILPDRLSLDGHYVIQESISQHQLISKISPSINTLRFVTYYANSNDVFIIGAYMRFGINNDLIDNVSSGGIAVGVDIKNMTLNQLAYDRFGRRYRYHPTSKVTFDKIQIPFWQAASDLAIQIQHSFSWYRLLGADIAITPKGPVVIEINSSPDMVALEQRCGPIFKDPIILKEFMDNDLLINRLQRSLYE